MAKPNRAAMIKDEAIASFDRAMEGCQIHRILPRTTSARVKEIIVG